jgi:hypothetical protein
MSDEQRTLQYMLSQILGYSFILLNICGCLNSGKSVNKTDKGKEAESYGIT